MNRFFPEIKKNFGFGLMRLPRLENGSIDIEQTSRMTDAFLAAGGRYFDTAYVYEGSEEAARKALLERHPRDSYYLASKFPGYDLNNMGKVEEIFEEQLRRCQTDYFDFYLFQTH